jgi:hypothetical protein
MLDTSLRAQLQRALNWGTLALPVAGLLAGTVAFTRGRPTLGLGLAGGAAAFGLARWQLQRLATESPRYELVRRVGDLEVRRYPSLVVAETLIEDGSWPRVLSEGFQRLAGYIFGANRDQRRLSMTAPVQATVHPHTEPRVGAEPARARTVTFLMPGDKALSDLPVPRDARVTLRTMPARTLAVLRFHGNYRSSLPARMARALTDRVRAAGLEPRGDILFAGYDPPTTLGLLRRNEVMVEVTPRDTATAHSAAP